MNRRDKRTGWLALTLITLAAGSLGAGPTDAQSAGGSVSGGVTTNAPAGLSASQAGPVKDKGALGHGLQQPGVLVPASSANGVLQSTALAPRTDVAKTNALQNAITGQTGGSNKVAGFTKPHQTLKFFTVAVISVSRAGEKPGGQERAAVTFIDLPPIQSSAAPTATRRPQGLRILHWSW